MCSLYRKELVGEIKVGAADVLFKQFIADEIAGRIMMIPNGKDVAIETEKLVNKAYNQPTPTMIRSLDAIHVASALTIKASAVITTDKRLKEVASLMRIKGSALSCEFF